MRAWSPGGHEDRCHCGVTTVRDGKTTAKSAGLRVNRPWRVVAHAPIRTSATGLPQSRFLVDVAPELGYIDAMRALHALHASESVRSRTGGLVASLTIRNIDDSLKTTLRLSAARHGRSMEEEARQLLRRALVHDRSSTGLGSRISRRFTAVGGVDLPDVTRSIPRQPPTFPSGDVE